MTLSKKKGIQFSLDFIYYEKFKELQNKLKRKNESDMTRYIVEKFIDDYEELHGEIKL